MRRQSILASSLLLFTAIVVADASSAEVDLRGVWHPETYVLSDGSRHVIDGLVFFSDTEWTFLVFVVIDGEPRRGEGEGGTYAWDDGELVFTHDFIILAGDEVGTLPETPLRMEVNGDAAATTRCQVSLDDDRLTVRFGPSGNAMVFRRG